jgi:hypothetical protein
VVSLFFFTSVLNQIIQALNVVISMQPSLSYPFHVRSFFADRETHGLPDRERLRLQHFSCGIRILTTHCGPDGQKHTTLCALKKLSTAPANKLTFTMREGQSMTIADYFQRTQNKPLQFPDVIRAEVCSISLSRTRLIHFQGWIRRPHFAG